MFFWLVLLAAALAVGGLLAAAMLHDPGYVLVAYGGITLETSLWLALGALVALWLTVAVVASLIRRSRAGGTRLAGWVRLRRSTAVRTRSVQGAMLLAEQRWRDAEQVLLEAAEKGDAGLADYLGAARAANAGNRFEQRDRILDQAKTALPEASFAVDLVRSELQQQGGQWRRSVATLEALRGQAPRHPVVLMRLFGAHKALADWQAVADLANALPTEAGADLDTVQVAVWRARLGSSQHSGDSSLHVRNTWKAMPKRLHDNEELLLEYAELAAPTDAEAALRQGLQRHWRASWVRRYGTLAGDVAKRRKEAGSWLAAHPGDADLQLTLGRLAVADGDVDQARTHFEASLQARRDAETLVELAGLADESGDQALANGYYREALENSRALSARAQA
ncbi:MAG: hypothetical protein OXG82_14185 [Gammaproteobacteria bacterium]|nr:hypothetical protein [Gammaproteobacteria bacterium]